MFRPMNMEDTPYNFVKKYNGNSGVTANKKYNILSLSITKDKDEEQYIFYKKIRRIKRICKNYKKYLPDFYIRLYVNKEVSDDPDFRNALPIPLDEGVQLVEFSLNTMEDESRRFKGAVSEIVKYYPLFDFDDNNDVGNVIVIGLNTNDYKFKKLAQLYENARGDLCFVASLFFAPFQSNDKMNVDFFNSNGKDIIKNKRTIIPNYLMSDYIESLRSVDLLNKYPKPEDLFNSVVIPYAKDTGFSISCLVNFEITGPFFYIVRHTYPATQEQLHCIDKDLEYILDSTTGDAKQKFEVFDNKFPKQRPLQKYEGSNIPYVDRFYEVVSRWYEMRHPPYPRFILEKLLENQYEDDEKLYWTKIYQYRGDTLECIKDMQVMTW